MHFLRDVIVELVNLTLLFLSLFIKRDDKKIMFGAWKGEKVADNPRYLMEYIQKNHPEYKCYWVINSLDNEYVQKYNDVVFVKQNSLKQLLAALGCKYFFTSHPLYSDICRYNNAWRGAQTVYLTHGACLKKVRPYYYSFPFKYIVTHNEIEENILKDYKVISDSNSALKLGEPRNDYLINADSAERERVKRLFAEKFSFSPDKTIITYMPTFRKHGAEIKSLFEYGEKSKELLNFLKENNCVMVEKFHRTSMMLDSFVKTENVDDVIVNIDNSVETQELLLITDILICDYTSAIADYALTGNKALFYVYDYDFYKDEDQGLNFTIDEYSYGPVVYDFENFTSELKKLILSDKSEFTERRQEVINRMLPFDKGDSCKKIFEKVILNNDN